MKLLAAFAAAFLAAASASAAELTVLSGEGAKAAVAAVAAVAALCTQFEQATGNKVDVHFSVNADVIKKAEAGEAFDVVVGNPPTPKANGVEPM